MLIYHELYVNVYTNGAYDMLMYRQTVLMRVC